MTRFLCVLCCAVLIFACHPGVVFSQKDWDSREFERELYADLKIPEEEMIRFVKSTAPIFEGLYKNMDDKFTSEITKRGGATPEEQTRIGTEILVDEQAAIRQSYNDSFRNFFSDEQYQKTTLRLFQMQEGLIQKLESADNPQAVLAGVSDLDMRLMLFGTPDFLDLSPEQRELITRLHKDYLFKERDIHSKAEITPEMLKEIQERERKIKDAATDEEREALMKEHKRVDREIMKHLVPQLKKNLREYHGNFMRVLTDAQKAKIQAAMNKMPDYMKTMLDEFEKGNADMSILKSWVPGMGVPDTPNPEREAQRDRPRGERTFPGD